MKQNNDKQISDFFEKSKKNAAVNKKKITTNLMSKFKLPSKKVNISEPQKATAANEKKISELINKGGSVSKKNVAEVSGVYKNINIKILDSELQTINELRDKAPKPRGKKIGISLHDWVVVAVQEKIARDSNKFP